MYQPKKIIVVTGHFGSGKTNFSTALALKLAAEGKKVTVVDFDLVNPYFRTADFKEAFAKRGITLRAPDYANTNVDIPSVQFDLGGLAAEEGYLIIDVGGDEDGAVALGRYSHVLNSYAETDELDMLGVVSFRRYLTRTADEAVQPDTAPKTVMFATNTNWLTIDTPLIGAVPNCPTIILSTILTKFVTRFCRIMGITIYNTCL